MLDNNDDYDFTPSNSSKLASLFGNASMNSESNSSLVYKAPKAPTQDVKESEDSVAKTLIISGKVVLLWKLENNAYTDFGKHGLAIIGSSERNVYEMIGYKEKTNIIFRIRINNTFIFYNQKDNFSTFYDTNLINWLIKFEGNDQDEFSRILESHDVQIVKNHEEIESAVVMKKPSILQKPTLISVNTADSLSDSSDSKQRANILNRMAKMGQAILPKSDLKNTSTDLSDSEIEEQKYERRIHPRQVKRAVGEKTLKHVTVTHSNIGSKSTSEPTNVLDKYQQQVANNEICNSQIVSNNQVMYNPQMIPSHMYPVNWANDSYTHLMIAQNTELKMNLAQITAKLDAIMNTKRIDEDVDKNSLKAKLKIMKLKTENLETALQKSEGKYSSLKMKYDELEKNLQDVNEIDSKNKEIDILENTILELKSKLKETQQKREELQCELETFQNKVKDFHDVITEQKNVTKEYDILKHKNKNLEKLNEDLKNTNEGLCEIIEGLKLQQKDSQDYFEKTEAEKKAATQISNTKIKAIEDIVKRHMNDMYQSILNNFEEQGTYNFSDVQLSVAKNLKVTSFKLIENCVNIVKDKSTLEE